MAVLSGKNEREVLAQKLIKVWGWWQLSQRVIKDKMEQRKKIDLKALKVSKELANDRNA